MKKSQTSLQVSVAVIEDEKGLVLITKRAPSQSQGNLWEFPGGKLAANETAQQALIRELQEELNITPTEMMSLISFSYDYQDRSICLHVWRVTQFSGELKPMENQPMRWVDRAELCDYDFPEANTSIISAINLPQSYIITPADYDKRQLKSFITQLVSQGFSLIQLRTFDLSTEAYNELAQDLYDALSCHRCTILLKGEIGLLNETWCKGLHLTSHQLKNLVAKGWRYEGTKWLAASCHSFEELKQAERVGCHFVTLSPVNATACHSDAKPLGFENAGEITSEATIPVYWLGGMTQSMLKDVVCLGAQGIAGISAFSLM